MDLPRRLPLSIAASVTLACSACGRDLATSPGQCDADRTITAETTRLSRPALDSVVAEGWGASELTHSVAQPDCASEAAPPALDPADSTRSGTVIVKRPT